MTVRRQYKRLSANADAILGSRIRARRLEMKWSQERLADELGLTFQQVQKYEKGSNRVSALRLCEIANLLNTTITGLLGDLGNGGKVTVPSKNQEFLATRFGAKLVEAAMHVKGRDAQQAVIELLRTMA